jgi:predicted regulator of Ras-like GTPase activity (Roadblock/LC7/MglB family)
MRAAIGEELAYELAAADLHEHEVCTCPLIASGAVDAARALADLVEVSPQIDAAAVVARDGEMVGSVGVPETRSQVLARAVRELLDGAAAARTDDGRVTQLHAALGDGDVYAVTGADGRTIAAVAGRRAAPGLVFYDLKRCLAALTRTGEDEGGRR